jgi:RNA polymerase sigma-70 factor (ECF subfamily)
MAHPHHEVIEHAAREAYGRVVAVLAARTGDLARAEDAVSDALHEALRSWPQAGVPASPTGWLVAVARRRLIDRARRDARTRPLTDLTTGAPMPLLPDDEQHVPDERLAMLLACASPEVEPGVRGPLMLQAALGLDAQTIAPLYAVSASAMAQRLVRAKARLRASGARFDRPEDRHVRARISDVADALYGAFTAAYDTPGESDGARLTTLTVNLARALVRLCPDEPECAGLLALMLFSVSRAHARRDGAGRYVPMREQDTDLWDRHAIAEAEDLLREASRAARPERYQIEAAIQSAHASRAGHEPASADLIVGLYDLLLSVAPGLGARVARAGALIEAGRASEALIALDHLEPRTVAEHQPYWGVRAHALLALGRAAEAREAFTRACGLSTDPAVRSYLLDRAARLPAGETRTG